jgi:hypothetical protein
MVFNKKDWDQPGDLLDKIYYVRYGKEGDPVFIKAGVLPDVTLGYGLIMDGYSNAIQYPDIKRIGVQASIRKGKIGFEALVNSLREFGNKHGGGVIGTRISYRPIKIFEVGLTGVVDLNQYANLNDRDGDGVPDQLDAYPDNKNKIVVSPVPSYEDLVAINPGFSDSTIINRARYDSLYTYINDSLERGIFNLDSLKTSDKLAIVYGADIGFPLIDSKLMKLVIYGQVAKIDKAGFGWAAPGVQWSIWRLKMMAEYRHFNQEFKSSYFNELYELERATINGTSAVAKLSTMEQVGMLQGYFASLGFDLKFVTLAASYEDMRGDSTNTDKTLYGQVSLAPKLIPKLSEATAYYKKTHVTDFSTWKQEGALLGYRVGYEISPGTSIVFKYQETYLDKNGDGKLETERITGIETAFTFK